LETLSFYRIGACICWNARCTKRKKRFSWSEQV